MRGCIRFASLFFSAVVICSTIVLDPLGAKTPDEAFDARTALDISQGAIGNKVSELSFVDSARRQVKLTDFMDKPLVVSLIYTGCIDVCPMVSETLANAVDVARDLIGQDAFRVVTIGFDAESDSPERMRMYAAERGLRIDGWNFLSADVATIDQLSRDLGFTFNPSPQGFDHMTQTSVIDTDGRVYRHIYGADFDTPLLVQPLKQLIYGGRIEMTSVEGLINRIKLFCTVYDPSSGAYRFDYSLILSILLGGLSMALVGTALVRAWRSGLGQSRPS